MARRRHRAPCCGSARENTAEVAPLLAYLRDPQRRHQLAVVVVHHARKGAGKTRDGQALRGGSEFHAWGDSNLYLRRAGDQLMLAVEQRAAASTNGIPSRCASTTMLSRSRSSPAGADRRPAPVSVAEKIERALADAATPLSLVAIRRACRVRTATLGEAIAVLARQGRIRKTAAGYELAAR